MCNRREDIKVGDKVMPVTPAGVCLRDKPTTGKYKEDYNVPCVFTSVGTVLKLKTVIIDYDSWPDDDTKLGKIEYTDCFIKCKNGTGWVGRGALMKKEDLFKDLSQDRKQLAKQEKELNYKFAVVREKCEYRKSHPAEGDYSSWSECQNKDHRFIRASEALCNVSLCPLID
jgi:hypothetical protein